MADKDSNSSAAVQHRITKFYTDVHADLVYCCTGYNVVSYFRSAFLKIRRKKRLKMPPPTAVGRILVARRFACPSNW